MNIWFRSFYNWYSQSLRNPRYGWLIVAGSLIYLFSPIDISPDFIPILGQLDDVVIITILATEVLNFLSGNFNPVQPSQGSPKDENQGEIIDVEAISID
ncbi:YkvA family protein [Gloeocapsa sp. PCC 73106]|uniref:YkvA family protein n=1 Tax=Gloeocapsa sp. PCC 73106 TaxID=102232 RepID=UPI0002ABE973|nr:hypothetical protein GLO73106DRAFT_00029180 [Gloeocapsa sp. PCC 73106]